MLIYLNWYIISSYLHGCVPPIVHGNLTCDTIFIQHNGLVKIGSVAPDAIHNHVKTCRENMRNMHLIAPEYGCKYNFSSNTKRLYGFFCLDSCITSRFFYIFKEFIMLTNGYCLCRKSQSCVPGS